MSTKEDLETLGIDPDAVESPAKPKGNGLDALTGEQLSGVYFSKNPQTSIPILPGKLLINFELVLFRDRTVCASFSEHDLLCE